MTSAKLLSFGFFSFLLLVLFSFPQAYAQKFFSPTKGYIVVLKDDQDSDQVAREVGKKYRAGIDQTYGHILKGFAAKFSDNDAAEIRSDSRVKFVVEDKEVHAFVKGPGTAAVQTIPTGISRITTASSSATNKGTGIGVAVIDTGIDLTHSDLSANIVANKSCVAGKRNGNDDNGHGTHVAGTIAALNNSFGVVGVAPEAKLIAVKVLNSQGSGTWSSVICGIDFVTANASRYNIKVANMSLGGGGVSDNSCGNTNNDPLHQAICRSRNAGVTYVVAAGNSAADANTFVPAAYDDAVITVSALADSDGQSGGLGSVTTYGPDDTFATFSNFGSVVDLGGPGVNIFSTYRNNTYATMSGTSMATPHVTGSAALFINAHPGSTWTQVRDGLKFSGEPLGSGHIDPSGKHSEPIVRAGI